MIYVVKNHDLGFRIIIFLLSTRVSPQSSCFSVLIILLPVYSYLKFQKSSQTSHQQQSTTSPKEMCRCCIVTVEIAVVFLYCPCNRLCPWCHWPVPTRALGMASKWLEAQSLDRQGACRDPGNYVGVSKNRGTPNTPKWWSLVGKPMVVGYHHFWKHPCV